MQALIDHPSVYSFWKFPLFNTYLPHAQLRTSVVIPAKDESKTLLFALDALRNQQQPDGQPLPATTFEVLLLLNNCADDSEAIARNYQKQHPAFPLQIENIRLPSERANVGTARRLLMDAACQRLLRVGHPDGIIASTDADTLVDSQWISQIQAEIENGCEAVGGRILTRPDGSMVRLNHLRDVTYRMLTAQLEAQLDPLPFDPWPRHFQHFGANMALTCAAYKRVGGLPDVANLEDEALYRALLRTDTPVRKSPHVLVTTSTRMQGRVDVGFSEQLRYWASLNQKQQCQLVESPDALVCRFQNRRQLRRLWQQRKNSVPSIDLNAVAISLSIDAEWLYCQFNEAAYFGQLWEIVEARIDSSIWANRWPCVPIKTAIAQLRQMVNAYSYR